MTTPPNVLFILSDQHNASWLGCAGHQQVLTPHLDALAAEGQRFTEAWCANPICTPSRVSMLSGQYPHGHGYFGLGGPTPARLPNLFGHFRAHGYRTAGIGKLHLPNQPTHWLQDSADLLEEIHAGPTPGVPSNFARHLARHGLADLEDSRGLGDCQVPGDHDGRPSRMPFAHCVESWMVETALGFLGECRAQAAPFFMQLSFPRPHHALTPDRRFWDLYPEDLELPAGLSDDQSHRPPHFRRVVDYLRTEHRWGYEPKTFVDGSRRAWRATLASVTQNDFFIGRVLDWLRGQGLLEQTIVVYSSDHGAYHGLHGVMEKAPGISSREVCQVPMIWRVPGCPGGRVSDALVESVDIAVTLPTLCGLPPLASAQGRDLTATLAGDDAPLRAVAVTELPWSKSIRFGAWRLVHYHRDAFDGADVGELYHQDDRLERRNRYHDADCAAIVAEGRRLLLEWLTASTRPVTAWPPPTFHPAAQGRPAHVDAGDGREPPELLRARLGDPRQPHTDPRHYL